MSRFHLASKGRHNFKTEDEQQLSDKIHCCRMDRECIHIWIAVLGPEVIGKKTGDDKGCEYLKPIISFKKII